MGSLFRAGLLLCFMLLTAAVAYPCSCEFMKPQKKLKQARAVFIGEVVEIGSNDRDRHLSVSIKFKVERYWKGITEPYIAVISAPDICCTCGLAVKVGVKYLIYAFDFENGQIETSLCTSAPLESETSRKELKALGKSKVLKSSRTLNLPAQPVDSIERVRAREHSVQLSLALSGLKAKRVQACVKLSGD